MAASPSEPDEPVAPPPDAAHQPPVGAGRDARAMRRASRAALITAACLVLGKAGAWLVTDSMSLLATLVDSLLDAAASGITLLAIRQALTPADRDHRFGHGKVEPMASLGQAAFVAGSAVFVAIAAGQRFIDPRAVQQPEIGIAVMAASTAATIALVAYQRAVVRRTGSLAIRGDSAHYLGDILANLAVIGGLAVTHLTGTRWLDPALAVLIAAYLLVVAVGIARDAVGMLMDRELPETERRRIAELVHRHARVLGMHDLRTRASGPQRFIQLHLELDGTISLADAKAIADAVHADIQAAYPDADVIIHQQPQDTA